ncbi:hypothetical protein UB33_05945 [Photobacterium angustum]|nr:hypothetical protein UB33_05945 [Photobacterium angustum]
MYTQKKNNQKINKLLLNFSLSTNSKLIITVNNKVIFKSNGLKLDNVKIKNIINFSIAYPLKSLQLLFPYFFLISILY